MDPHRLAPDRPPTFQRPTCRPGRWLGHSWCAALLLALLTACGTTPGPRMSLPGAFGQVQTQSKQGVTVALTLLDDEQARQHFEADFGKHDIQAAWISIRNGSGHGLWFIRNMLDPDFYSADEVALMVRGDSAAASFDDLRQRIRDDAIRVFLHPDSLTEGYVFLPKVEGGRFLDVSLQADAWAELEAAGRSTPHARELRFGFTVALPDGEFDFEQLDAEKIYAGQALPDLSDSALREALEKLPCCATDGEGHNQGDPLNIVMVGESGDVLNALTRSGWTFTHRITLHTIGREIGAALSGAAYPVAPVSNLYALGRSHDLALQRARRSIAQRNHLRLWLAPFRFMGRPVWIGQVSRDIGVKLTTKSPTLTTHIIDPEVDATREYLLHSLLAQRLIESFGFARGSAQATPSAPRVNLTDDPYFSDGLRLVMVLTREPVPVHQIRNLMWERSAAPIAEGQSPAAQRHVRPLDRATE